MPTNASHRRPGRSLSRTSYSSHVQQPRLRDPVQAVGHAVQIRGQLPLIGVRRSGKAVNPNYLPDTSVVRIGVHCVDLHEMALVRVRDFEIRTCFGPPARRIRTRFVPFSSAGWLSERFATSAHEEHLGKHEHHAVTPTVARLRS